LAQAPRVRIFLIPATLTQKYTRLAKRRVVISKNVKEIENNLEKYWPVERINGAVARGVRALIIS
jgi:hypothetical protein